MTAALRTKLIRIAQDQISHEDVSHDWPHTSRVLANAEFILKQEGGDEDILIPAALFHDLIVYPKNHPQRHRSQVESAGGAVKILSAELTFPQHKISKVKTCILECSFSQGIKPELWESKILQDADALEVTGAIAIMRTFSSAGQMQNPFYHPEDPFCEQRSPDAKHYAVDLFYERLLVAKHRMHTQTARGLAEGRTRFLEGFLAQLQSELSFLDS